MSEKNTYNIYYDNYMNTNAQTEVTGLIPSGISTRDQWDSYRDIFNFEPVCSEDEAVDAGNSPTKEDSSYKG